MIRLRFKGSLLLLFLLMLAMSAPPSSTLGKLKAENPRGYLDLGEELLATSASDEDLQRAREVLAIGVGLADRSGNYELAASGCIALAAYARQASERAWLWDLAVLLDQSRIDAWQQFRNGTTQDTNRVRAAECLFFARNGDPTKADERLDADAIREEIAASAARNGIDPDRFISVLKDLIENGFNDDCKGRIFITRAKDGQAVRSLCQQHQRPLGTCGNDEMLRQFLMLEIDLLETGQGITQWESAEYVRLERPVRDPSVGELLDQVGVDLSRPFWRDNRWAPRP